MYYGFITENGEFKELFAEGIWGRSHLGCGTIHHTEGCLVQDVHLSIMFT